jgi:hypothetical protein
MPKLSYNPTINFGDLLKIGSVLIGIAIFVWKTSEFKTKQDYTTVKVDKHEVEINQLSKHQAVLTEVQKLHQRALENLEK